MENNNNSLSPVPNSFINVKPSKKEIISLIIAFCVGFIFFQLFFFPLFDGIGIGFGIFVIAFQLTAGYYLSGRKFVFSKLSILTFIPVVLMAISIATFRNNYIIFFNIVATWFFSVLNLLVMCSLEEYPFKSHLIKDVFVVTFAYPFKNLGVTIKRYFSPLKSKTYKTVLIVLLTLLILSPAVTLILFLLGLSDANFKSMTDAVIKFLSNEFSTYVFKAVLSIIFGFLTINVFFNLSTNKQDVRNSLSKPKNSYQKLPSVVPIVALCVFSIIYTSYMFIQASYIFSALVSKLPNGYTYSEYARQGFFELCLVVFFNLVLLGLIYLLTKRVNDILPLCVRIPSAYLILCTILLTTTALSKMVLYINSYGLTLLRFYTAFFMTVVFILSIYLLIKTFIPSFKFSQFSFVTVIGLYILLNFSNVDGIVAKVNIERYKQTGKIDVYSFVSLAPSAIPSYIELKDDKDISIRDDVNWVLDTKKTQISNKNFVNMAISDYIAREYLE